MIKEKWIEILGDYYGKIWMPMIECSKSFHVSTKDWPFNDGQKWTLREILLKILNDGDFQSTSLTKDTMVIFHHRSIDKSKSTNVTVTKTRVMEIDKFKSVKDLIGDKEGIDIEGEEE